MTDDDSRSGTPRRFRGAFSVPADHGADEAPEDAPTEVIPRITDQTPVPDQDAPTDVIPRVVVDPAESAYRDAPTEVIPRFTEGLEPAEAPPAPPTTGSRSSQRVSARVNRRAQRNLRILSGFGEVLISLGAVLALYVVYTLWWTNVEAHKAAATESKQIQQQFQQQLQKPGANPAAPLPTVFRPSEGFGLMTIPAIGKADIPVMQGTDKEKVLDKGAVGHYTTPKTAMPWDATGNFAVAAHRRTYGEPFRYINQLKIGDHVVVETARGWFVYTLDKELPQTDPGNIGTIAPVPKGGPYTKPGRYLTLTTCTPEWASTYRLIWWGHLERIDPLSGPPPAELKEANRRA
ncbi:MAG: class E sortase [Catenulispora sp.]